MSFHFFHCVNKDYRDDGFCPIAVHQPAHATDEENGEQAHGGLCQPGNGQHGHVQVLEHMRGENGGRQVQTELEPCSKENEAPVISIPERVRQDAIEGLRNRRPTNTLLFDLVPWFAI